MLSFSEYVKYNRTFRLAEHAFVLMIRHGHDPVAFVDQYTDGEIRLEMLGPVPTGAWASPQPATDALDPDSHQRVTVALGKLQNLMQQGDWFFKKDQDLQQALGNIINTLSMVAQTTPTAPQPPVAPPTAPQPPVAPPAASPAPATGASLAPTPGPAVTTTWHIPDGDVLIERVLRKCAMVGINPKDFAEWYVNEGVYCENAEVFEGRFGNWLGAIGKGIASWGKKIFGYGKPNEEGFWKGYGSHYDWVALQQLVLPAKQIIDELDSLPLTNQHFKQQLQIAVQRLEAMQRELNKTLGTQRA